MGNRGRAGKGDTNQANGTSRTTDKPETGNKPDDWLRMQGSLLYSDNEAKSKLGSVRK